MQGREGQMSGIGHHITNVVNGNKIQSANIQPHFSWKKDHSGSN